MTQRPQPTRNNNASTSPSLLCVPSRSEMAHQSGANNLRKLRQHLLLNLRRGEPWAFSGLKSLPTKANWASKAHKRENTEGSFKVSQIYVLVATFPQRNMLRAHKATKRRRRLINKKELRKAYSIRSWKDGKWPAICVGLPPEEKPQTGSKYPREGIFEFFKSQEGGFMTGSY